MHLYRNFLNSTCRKGGIFCEQLTDKYRQIAEEAPFLLIDGELPWGYWSFEDGGWIVDGYSAAIRLAEHRYTSLSLIHNYHEDGSKIRRSVYEYIRDHLGYNLEAVELDLNFNGKLLSLKLKIKNNGLAAPLALKGSKFVLINGQGEIISSIPAGDPTAWHSHAPDNQNRYQILHSVEAVLQMPEVSSDFKLGLYIYNSAGEGVRLGNDIPFEDGVNILTNLSI